MAKFVFLYVGGAMPETPEAQADVMKQWEAWLGQLGGALSETGNPFAASATVGPSGTTGSGASNVGGYSVISAESLAAATALTAGCPALSVGGSVEVYEAVEM
jgi:hypothetical protein